LQWALSFPSLAAACRVAPGGSRNGYRFAKYQGESMVMIAEKLLQIAGF
jgi:hypothetical protein